MSGPSPPPTPLPGALPPQPHRAVREVTEIRQIATSSYLVPCPAETGARSGRDASSSTWAPPPSTNAASTSHPFPTSGCRPLLLEGEALHRDSFGTEQVIAPAGLNPMTSGTGVSHSEEGTGLYRGGGHGVQLCVVQVPTTRVGPADFEPHAELLPVELDHGIAIVLVGESVSSVSPARRDTVHDGVDLDLREGASRIPRGRDHEHARLVLAGRVLVDGTVVEPDRLAYLGMGRDELGWTAAADRFGRAASGRPRVEVGPPEWRRP